MIKDYFPNFDAFNKDTSVDLGAGKTVIHAGKQQEDWEVHLVDTGLNTQTGRRLKRLKRWLEKDDLDTLREMNYLEELWQASKAPWKVW